MGSTHAITEVTGGGFKADARHVDWAVKSKVLCEGLGRWGWFLARAVTGRPGAPRARASFLAQGYSTATGGSVAPGASGSSESRGRRRSVRRSARTSEAFSRRPGRRCANGTARKFQVSGTTGPRELLRVLYEGAAVALPARRRRPASASRRGLAPPGGGGVRSRRAGLQKPRGGRGGHRSRGLRPRPRRADRRPRPPPRPRREVPGHGDGLRAVGADGRGEPSAAEAAYLYVTKTCKLPVRLRGAHGPVDRENRVQVLARAMRRPRTPIAPFSHVNPDSAANEVRKLSADVQGRHSRGYVQHVDARSPFAKLDPHGFDAQVEALIETLGKAYPQMRCYRPSIPPLCGRSWSIWSTD